MRIVGRQVLEAFCRRHPDATRWVEHWLADADSATWRTPFELKSSYAAVSFLGRNARRL